MWDQTSGTLDIDLMTAVVSIAFDAASRLGGLAQHVACDDHTALTHKELEGRVLRLERTARSLDAARAHAQAELDTRNVPDETHGMRTGAWIADRTSTPHADAKRRVAIARRLRDEFPLLDTALTDGTVSWFHCEAFCTAANERLTPQLAHLLPELIELAHHVAFGPWQRELWRVARRLDLDGGYDDTRDDTASRVHLNGTLGGVRELSGRLVGVLGASFDEMLTAETDRHYRLAQQLHDTTAGEVPIPSRAYLRALALVELCRRGTGTHTTGSGSAPATDLTIVHHTHTTGHGQAPALADALEDLRAACFDEYQTLHGDLFSSRHLACHLCDPHVHPISGTDVGEQLNLGRTQRLANRAQRRAAHRRDGGCSFPGCDVPARWTDLHHVDWWERGGLTDIDNLACLCRYHHGVTHRTGWTMTATGNGTYTWTTPAGRTLHSQHHGIPSQPRAGP